MIHPLDFKVENREDLLVWADLWEDHGFPRHALACQILHKNNRWPSKYPGGNGVQWHPTRWGGKISRHHLRLDIYGIYNPDRTCYARRYPNRTLAFLDIINHMAAAFSEEHLADLLANKIPQWKPPS